MLFFESLNYGFEQSF